MDTNILSDLIRNPDGVVARHIEKVGPKEIFTNLIVAAELRYGCSNKGSPKLLARVKGLLETIPVLPMDTPLDIEYGRIRSELEAAGQTIGINDLLIASHASALGLTMVTDNTSEFSRIQGLRVENWLRD